MDSSSYPVDPGSSTTRAPSNKFAFMTTADVDKQEKHAHQAPQVVNSMDLPEVVPHYVHPYGHEHPSGSSAAYSGTTPYSASELTASPHPFHAQPVTGAVAPPSAKGASHFDQESKRKKGILGRCSTLVFALCIIIAILLVTTIGLAAGTGIGFRRADSAQAQVDILRTTTPNVTFAMLDRNCTDDADSVTGTKYDTFSIIGSSTFTIQCNKDATGDPLMSLFTPDFDGCMDACAAWSRYTPTSFGSNATNTTCGAVSFVPLWTNKTIALAGTAPGNCYLKPTQTASPTVPNIGTEVHAGILDYN